MKPRDSDPTPVAVRLYRATRLLLHLVRGVLTVALLFPFFDKVRRQAAVARWSAQSLAILNVVPQVHGTPPPGGGAPRMLVANHISWLDIQLIHAVWQVRFVAKSEVRRWPLIGWLSARTGTLFIERGSGRRAARLHRDIHAAFEAGDAVGVFPEGTTTEGDRIASFHASLLQPAVDEGALVCPVGIRYVDVEGRTCKAAGYVGDDSLLDSFRAILAQRRIVAELHFLAPIEAQGRTRRELARLAREAIATRLGLDD